MSTVSDVYINTSVFIVYLSELESTISIHNDRVDGYSQMLQIGIFHSSDKDDCTHISLRMVWP